MSLLLVYSHEYCYHRSRYGCDESRSVSSCQIRIIKQVPDQRRTILMAICLNGHQVTDGVKFCGVCGAPLQNAGQGQPMPPPGVYGTPPPAGAYGTPPT